MKATEQYFPVILFIMLYKVVLTFESVDEILWCEHSNKSNWAVPSRGAVYYALQGGCNFEVCGWNLRVWPFKWKLLSSYFDLIFRYLGCDPFNQNFRKFRSKTQWIGSVQAEKFRKNRSTFWGGPLFPVGPVGILDEWIAPLEPISTLFTNVVRILYPVVRSPCFILTAKLSCGTLIKYLLHNLCFNFSWVLQ